MRENLLPDALVYMVEDLGLGPDMFGKLQEEIEWAQSRSFVYGQWHDQPRLTALYGAHTYDYGGVSYNPECWDASPSLKACRARVEEFIDVNCNAVVCNLYRNGQDSIGWHSDNERELGWNPVIVSLSFGATRRFSFRRAGVNGTVDRHNFLLPDNSMLVMLGPTQANWQHCVPKESKVTEPRINLTFRTLR